MSHFHQKLSIREKVGYGLGDTAANFIFQTILVFQLAFYTDTFGISAAAAGTLFLIVRISDAFTDPLMGIIADRTKTKWGRFRPWILWSAVPFGVLAFLTFSTPDFGPTGKLIYAYITYTLLMAVYTVNNLPYSALSGVMTGDMGERTSLSSYRFVFAMLAAFAIQGLALPMVNYFGQGNDAQGYKITMGIFAFLAVIFFIITFFSTKERILPDPAQKTSIKQDLLDLTKNGPWIAIFFLTLFTFITLALRGGVMLYYFRYYLDLGQGLDLSIFGMVRQLNVDEVFSLFNVCGLTATVIGIVFSKAFAVRFGKRNVFIAGLAGTIVLTAVLIFFPADAIMGIFTLEFIRQLAYGVTVPLLWAMMADVADYSEWKNHRRATGIVFSAVVFGLKAGLGFGGAIGGWLLALYGYVPNAAQTAESLWGIRMTASVYPAITFLIGIICLFFYKIDLPFELKIADELAERRHEFNNPQEATS
ncbi:MAG: MFS transporter [Rhodothermales bacterium]|nr:MFS transporter [Rhodothermales bacterium]